MYSPGWRRGRASQGLPRRDARLNPLCPAFSLGIGCSTRAGTRFAMKGRYVRPPLPPLRERRGGTPTG
jgi:hypothetical protein